MDEFWRFSKLRKVNMWYIREKGVFRKVLVVDELKSHLFLVHFSVLFSVIFE